MFDVNLNKIELDTINRLLEIDTPGARAEVVEVIENLLEIRYNRGKRQGEAMFRDAIIDGIVHELKR